MQVYTSADYKLMPWKNGGGTTLELFCLRNQQDEILFRLSSASVKNNGPFSLFPHIDRILFLVSGKGFKLQFSDFDLTMSSPLSPITFAGEENIHCELLEGECTDFNIMTDRRFGKAHLTIKNIERDEKLGHHKGPLFLYFPSDQKLLKLLHDQEYHHDTDPQLAYIITLDLNNFHN